MLHKIISLIFSAIIGLVFCGCTSVSYTGQTYPPTEHIQVYYSKKEILKPYHVMGKAIASTWYSFNNESLRPALVEKAKACGADAMIIDDIKEKVSGPIRVENDSEIDDGRMEANHPGGSFDDDFLYTGEEGDETTEEVDISKIVAEFLKYK